MEEVLDTAGVIIIRYLTDTDLEVLGKVNMKFKEICESTLLWRSLLSSFNPRKPKEQIKEVRVRTSRPRPNSKQKPPTKSEIINSKQWIFIPPDLESQLKVITINKAAQLRRNEEFKSRCFQVMETWTESISRTLNILENQEICGDDTNPYSMINYWKDKIKIIDDILNELNDACVAKVDVVFNGTKPHKNFISIIDKTKKHYKEAKEICSSLGKIEPKLKDLNSLVSFEAHIKDILAFLEDFSHLENWKSRVTSIFDSLVTKYFSLLEKLANFNNIFSNTDYSLLRTIRISAAHFVSSTFVSTKDNMRPSTSYARPAPSTRENCLPLFLHIVNVCNDLCQMLEVASNNTIPSQVLKIYTDIPVEFNIWKHENQLFWAQLVRAFYERLKSKTYIEVPEDSSSEGGEEGIIVPNWSVS